MIIDTHAHYDDEAFEEDRNQVLNSLYKNNIEKIINVGASLQGCRKTIELTEKYAFVYGSLGVHPQDVENLTDEDLEWIFQESKKEKIVAIGEIGLDYYYDTPDKEVQKEWFIRQIKLAHQANLPMVIHSRDAAFDTLSILRTFPQKYHKGVIHCYSYSKETAREFLEMGFSFGIGGVLTFKNGKKLQETVEYLPLDKIILETDAPYLAPDPFRGKRNSSVYLSYVVKKIAEIKQISEDEVIAVTKNNALNLFPKMIEKEKGK